MSEIRKGAVIWKVPTDLEGPEVKVGDKAPSAFTLIGTDMGEVKGTDFSGSVRILCAVPSLDTPVCDIEMRRFNTEAAKLPGVTVAAVSLDLPFAAKRWCGATGSDKIRALSDYKFRDFGTAYGVLAPSKGLLARAVFVIGKDDVVKYAEYVADVGKEPNYDAALAAAKSLV
ncbi:MAG TPA: thiol peroxidase [Polyangiaceae bacterium]|jgi:thiol peroxidase|nr:thiol peroxidase [Polyangiaceae bacterium]